VNADVTVKVVFSPVFRAVFHQRETEVVLPEGEADVGGLLMKLSEKSAGQIDPLVFEKRPDLISAALMILVNDRVYTGTALNRRAVALDDQDIVSLLYYISGG